MYQETINSLKETRTFSKHITELGKILMTTEDPQLRQLVDAAYGSMQRTHANAKGGKSTPGHLYKSQDIFIRRLIAYCESHIQTGKPEWQVMAEINGWTPPATS